MPGSPPCHVRERMAVLHHLCGGSKDQTLLVFPWPFPLCYAPVGPLTHRALRFVAVSPDLCRVRCVGFSLQSSPGRRGCVWGAAESERMGEPLWGAGGGGCVRR